MQLYGEIIFETVLSGYESSLSQDDPFANDPCLTLHRDAILSSLQETGSAVRQCYDVSKENVDNYNQLFQQTEQRSILINNLTNCKNQNSETEVKNCFVNIVRIMLV